MHFRSTAAWTQNVSCLRAFPRQTVSSVIACSWSTASFFTVCTRPLGHLICTERTLSVWSPRRKWSRPLPSCAMYVELADTSATSGRAPLRGVTVTTAPTPFRCARTPSSSTSIQCFALPPSFRMRRGGAGSCSRTTSRSPSPS